MIVVKGGNEFVEFGNRAWPEDQKISMGSVTTYVRTYICKITAMYIRTYVHSIYVCTRSYISAYNICCLLIHKSYKESKIKLLW